MSGKEMYNNAFCIKNQAGGQFVAFYEKEDQSFNQVKKKVFTLDIGNCYDPELNHLDLAPEDLIECKLRVVYRVDSYNSNTGIYHCLDSAGGGRYYNLNEKRFRVFYCPLEDLPTLSQSRKESFVLADGNYYNPRQYKLDIDPTKLVGCKLSIKWKNAHYTCKVVSYNPQTTQHYCIYDDGDCRYYNLRRKSFKVIYYQKYPLIHTDDCCFTQEDMDEEATEETETVDQELYIQMIDDYLNLYPVIISEDDNA